MATEGAARLAAFLGENAKAIEVVAQQRDADSAMVDRALAIVRQFIVDRNLILFGGLAIDYALRLKGSRLYPDDERPDFDFLSPRSVDDAYDLAEMLRAAGFESVSAVRAIHVQTMRVGTDFVWVADIGYAPQEVFDRIPTLDFPVPGGRIRFAHPDYQRMDQHLAFCFPFNGAPREDVFHRWRKDLKRFNLYAEHYPIVMFGEHARSPTETIAPSPGKAATTGKQKKLVRAASGLPLVGDAKTLRVALHGFAAYAYLRRTLNELVTQVAGLVPGFERPAVNAPHLALRFPDRGVLEVEVPAGDVAVVASTMPEEVAAVDGAAATWFEPYMDLTPITVRVGDLLVYSTRGRLLSTSVGRAGKGGGAKKKSEANPAENTEKLSDVDGDILVVSPQYLLLHFLFETHRTGDAVYRDYYCHVLEILAAAEKVFAVLLGADRGAEKVMELWADSPFAPTTHTLGEVNHDSAYIIRVAGFEKRIGKQSEAVRERLHLPNDLGRYLQDLPQNYYPDGKKARPAVDYAANSLFRRAGQPIAKKELLI